jgi:hypothetical protein
MFKNYIKEIQELNQIDLHTVKGTKLYYSKSKNTFNAIFFGLLVIVLLWSIIELITFDYSVIWFCLGALLFTYEFLKSLSKLLCKNPLLILSEGKLYYLKTQSWYSIENYIFEDKFYITSYSWFNPSRTFYMEDKNQQEIFAINNWYLSDSDDFKRKLTYQRAMIIKDKHKNNLTST